MRRKVVLILLISLIISSFAEAQEYKAMVNGRDTIYYNYLPIPQQTRQQKFKTTFSVVPLYTPAISFAIGASMQGAYSTKSSENSIFSIAAMASVRGMYSVGVDNVNYFSKGKHRLTVSLSASSMPTKFWGIGYNAAMQNSALNYTSREYSAQVEYICRVAKNLYLGPSVEFDYGHCVDGFGAMEELLPDAAKGEIIATTISAILKYDTRDSKQNPQKGVYISVRPFVRPRTFSNGEHTSFGAEGSIAGYQRLWKGATLAAELYTLLSSRYTPWQFYATVGGGSRMRGYYEGQFTDRNLATLQVEITQNVWRGLGVAAWAGAGNCFSDFSNFSWNQTLPTYGVGIRWVTKESLVLRFDYGFGAKVGGKIINGPLFCIGSAF